MISVDQGFLQSALQIRPFIIYDKLPFDSQSLQPMLLDDLRCVHSPQPECVCTPPRCGPMQGVLS